MISEPTQNCARISASPAERWIIGSTIVVVPLVYSLRTETMLHPKGFAIGVGAILLATVCVWRGRALQSGFQAFAPLWALVGVSALLHGAFGLAAAPHFAWLALAQGALILLFASILCSILGAARDRAFIANALVISAALAAALGLLQYHEWLTCWFPPFPDYGQPMYSVFGNRNLLGVYIAMALPLAVMGMWRGGRPAPAYAAAVMVILSACVLSQSRTAWLAGAIGLAAALIAGHASIRNRLLTAGGCCVLIASAFAWSGGAGLERLRMASGDSGLGLRMWFWDGALRMIIDHPVAGVGPGNFAHWSPAYLGEALWAEGGSRHAANSIHTLHAHNDLLELLAAFGSIGVIFVAWMLVRLSQCRGPEKLALMPLAAGAVVHPIVSSPAHAFAAAVLAACLLARETPWKGPERIIPSAVMVSAIGLTVFLTWAHWLPGILLRAAHDARIEGRESVPQYQAIADQPWPNSNAQRGLAAALMEAGRFEEAIAYWYKANDNGLDTGELWFGLGYSAFRTGDDTLARTAMQSCVDRWPRESAAWAVLLAAHDVSAWETIAADAARFFDAETWNGIRDFADELRRERRP